MTVDAFAVALSTVFDPARAEGLDAVVALQIGDDHLVARVRDGRLVMRRGQAESPDAVLGADLAHLREVLWRGRPLRSAESEGDVRVTGSRAVVRRFLRLFPAPVPVAAA